MSRKPPPDRTDTLANILRSGLDDIHAKLLNEAWFGRPGVERQQAYADMRAFYGRAPETPEGWGRMDWADRLKEQPRSRAEDEGPEIEL